MHENPDFADRELAALVASKVYYHLGEFEDSVTFALGAGDKLNFEGEGEEKGKKYRSGCGTTKGTDERTNVFG